MNVRTAGRATAAVAALGTVLGPMAAASPVAAAPARSTASGTAATAVRPARPATLVRPAVGARPVGRSQVGSCGSRLDYRLQAQASIDSTTSGAPSRDVIQLYYSPTTRCVYAKYLNRSGQCAPGLVNCRANVVVRFSDGTYIQGDPCVVPTGDDGCITPFISDANREAAGKGTRQVSDGSATWFGKTVFW
jgi:hypothetical protein